MAMTIEECYTQLHGNYSEAKSRLMNDRLVEKFMLKFPGDDSMATLRAAVAAGDIEASFRAAHTLKGVTANLAFTELQAAASALTEQLRPCAEPADPALMAAVEDAYALVISTLDAYEASRS